MIDICISPQINISINGELTVSNLVKAIKELNIEKSIVIKIIEDVNNFAVTEYCGEKSTNGNGLKRYQRANTFTRKIRTMLGEINLKLNKIHDTVNNDIFVPLYEKIGFNKGKNYQDDISITCVDMATKMTYRDTIKEAQHFINEFPSPATLQRMVKKHGKKIDKFNKEKIKEEYNEKELEYFYADGTKSHSQENHLNKNDINVALGTNKKGKKILLDLQVNKPWESTNEELKKLNVLKDDVCLISDAEVELRNALISEKGFYQIDTIHLVRDTLYKLWQDNELDLKQRKSIKKELESIIYYQINSTKKYKNDKEELKKRINQCIDKLKALSEKLIELGCIKTAKFINKYSNYAVTYSILSLEDKEIPWNSNIIERLMGEIQKRCKHKWMRWTTEGQKAMLNLILTQYTNPEYYNEYKNKILKNENLKNIKTKINIL